jgi:hypothetical protein
MENQQLEIIEMEENVKKNNYLVSIMSKDMTLWTCYMEKIPIFDLTKTKIFRILEDGTVSIVESRLGNEVFLRIEGVKVEKIYDFYSYP